MGQLVYNSSTWVDMDDRTLAHLQIVIGAKLRRGEGFPFRWALDSDEGEVDGLWIAPGISLRFAYDRSELPQINLDWIDALTASANSDFGLQVVPEPASVLSEELDGADDSEPAQSSGD